MSFLKRIFGFGSVDGMALAESDSKDEYAQIDLLSQFESGRELHNEREQREWQRVLSASYKQQLQAFQKYGWLTRSGDQYRTTPEAGEILSTYRKRQKRQRTAIRDKVRRALEERDTGEALSLRRRYESLQPLGRAEWTGPEPQLSHSALTRRILFLEHWLVDDLDDDAEAWLKLHAAEQHLWGTSWRADRSEIPVYVAQNVNTGELGVVEAVYWKAQSLIRYVENQETWQRCKGGDHVRRIEIEGPDDERTCDICRELYGEQHLVDRVPELPHKACTAMVGCRCTYAPVLETYEDLPS